MAFKNEFLTEEEKQWFQEQQIPNPANKLIQLHPSRWTIDRERNMYFLPATFIESRKWACVITFTGRDLFLLLIFTTGTPKNHPKPASRNF